ncbi:GIY-YIG homing endonuclease [Shigella phage Silverhawkium]|uniref:GIY-YIG homing endonuclease n=1 Tax=Shigella phage Silverhawkium TaxID=2530185 RepID=A0A482JK47_9CAUD|nr:GIY-YIG homing endonuclease [Shigella phage Silverhawkium]
MKIKGFGDCPTYGHWVSLCGEIDPAKLFGFVYLVYCKKTGQYYIGKKQFNSITKKKVAGKTRRKVVTKESDWMVYQTSSEYIKKDIEAFGEKEFDFYIIQTYYTRGGLVYGEANLQHKFDVMTKRIDSKLRLFYNANIAAIKFLTKETYEEAEKRIQKIMKLNERENHV